MPLSDRFRENILQIYTELQDIASDEDSWGKDLVITLKSRDFNAQQIGAIKNAAEKSVFTDNGSKSTPDYFTEELVKAFIDPVNSSTTYFEPSIIEIIDDKMVLTQLLKTRQALDDITHNYRLLIHQDNMPSSIDHILGQYENDIIPLIDDTIETMANETDINIDEIKVTMAGLDHFSKLPENLFITNQHTPPSLDAC